MFALVENNLTDEVINQIKFEGKVSGIQKVFEDAKAYLIKTVNAYNKLLESRANNGGGQVRRPATASPASGNGNGNGNGNAGNGNGGGKPYNGVTLDDILNDPEKVLPGLKKGAY
jgi:hypothetical protein